MNEKIKNYIANNLVTVAEAAEFSDDDDIFELGFVNSLAAMKLINYIELEFSIAVDDEDMDLANFNSVNSIVNFINNKS